MFEPSKLFEVVGEPLPIGRLKEGVAPHVGHLLKAADLIRRHGLAKHTQQDDKGSMCVHGALSIAIFGKPYGDAEFNNCAAARALQAELLARGIPSYKLNYHAAQWNNEPERTAAEVIEVLEASAVRAQAALERL